MRRSVVALVDQLLAAGLVHLRERLDVGAGAEDDRDRGGEDDGADALVLDLPPDRAEVLDDLRRDRVHRRVGEPGDRDVAAGLELHRVGLVAVVGLRVGVEALAALGAEPALGDEALEDRRRREALAVLGLHGLQPLERDVEAHHVGLHERREQAAARVEAGAGHHPEVDLPGRADALLEHQAGLDERLQRPQLGELLAVRVGVALDLRLAVLVEAVAAGLGAELPLGHQLLHALVDVEAVAVGVAQVLGDVQDRVEAEHVDEDERADRCDLGGADALVDRLDREPLLLLGAPDLADGRVEDAVDDEARDLAAGDRLLADLAGRS